MNREFLLLSQALDLAKRNKIEPSNYLCSPKLDGVRAIWIPYTAGQPINMVPFANRARDTREHVATGLWTRYAKVIHAPQWWLEGLPADRCMDGELWSGRQKFNDTVSAVKKLEPVDDEWKGVRFMIFDSPHYDQVYLNGRIDMNRKTSNYRMEFKDFTRPTQGGNNLKRFDEVYYGLLRDLPISFSKDTEGARHQILPQTRCLSWEHVDKMAEYEFSMGGEGVMMRRMSSPWIPKRSPDLLKYKAVQDAEGTVVGWTPGKERHEGAMGSLRIRMDNGKEFDLGGFTDEERRLISRRDDELTYEYPEAFRSGTRITYRYRELTPDGIPREARYHRKHEGV